MILMVMMIMLIMMIMMIVMIMMILMLMMILINSLLLKYRVSQKRGGIRKLDFKHFFSLI